MLNWLKEVRKGPQHKTEEGPDLWANNPNPTDKTDWELAHPEREKQDQFDPPKSKS